MFPLQIFSFFFCPIVLDSEYNIDKMYAEMYAATTAPTFVQLGERYEGVELLNWNCSILISVDSGLLSRNLKL